MCDLGLMGCDVVWVNSEIDETRYFRECRFCFVCW